MYGLFTYIWVVLMVNVGKYTIHWASGYTKEIQKETKNVMQVLAQSLEAFPLDPGSRLTSVDEV